LLQQPGVIPFGRFSARDITDDSIWDIPSLSNTPVANLEGHTGNITALAYSAQSKWIVTGSEDGTVRVWDTRYVLLPYQS
jgi:WD40 repeat protein